MTSFTFNELNNVVDPYNDDILIRTLFNLSVEGKDICSQCKERCDIVSCNKCGGRFVIRIVFSCFLITIIRFMQLL